MSGIASAPALWIARHAPPSARGICYGRADIEVALAHEDSAERLASSYPGAAPKTVWSSPLSRCRAVAERLAARLETELAIDESLHELHFGEWESRAWDDIVRDDAARFRAWSDDWRVAAPPGGESARDLESRVRRWWSRLERGGSHALVAHAGVARALQVIALGVPWERAMSAPIAHLAWSRVPFDRTVASLAAPRD